MSMAVSYTHLDVYKRQATDPLLWNYEHSIFCLNDGERKNIKYVMGVTKFPLESALAYKCA